MSQLKLDSRCLFITLVVQLSSDINIKGKAEQTYQIVFRICTRLTLSGFFTQLLQKLAHVFVFQSNLSRWYRHFQPVKLASS